MHASLDTLPLDALVQILCKLSHDELKPLICVSRSFHDAARLARQLHFNFATPSPKKTLAFSGKIDAIPDAPLLRLESKTTRKFKLSEEEIRGIAVVLFPGRDCKRGLISKIKWRPDTMTPQHN